MSPAALLHGAPRALRGPIGHGGYGSWDVLVGVLQCVHACSCACSCAFGRCMPVLQPCCRQPQRATLRRTDSPDKRFGFAYFIGSLGEADADYASQLTANELASSLAYLQVVTCPDGQRAVGYVSTYGTTYRQPYTYTTLLDVRTDNPLPMHTQWDRVCIASWQAWCCTIMLSCGFCKTVWEGVFGHLHLWHSITCWHQAGCHVCLQYRSAAFAALITIIVYLPMMLWGCTHSPPCLGSYL